ncbi:MAG: succinate dehydrogenase, cytochrome b556 subunit [Gammaproteobacteria bacterium]|nr:succinate dehydrogenase, cytochrome b556 subunit [Gammaproteobacteria bacterium]
MRTERPVFLSLLPTDFHWPVTAIASIVHRLTGVGLFIGLAFLLWLLDLALSSEGGFVEAGRIMSLPMAKLAVLFILANLIYHMLAGVKHMLMDVHVGDSFEAASLSAWIVFTLSAIGVAAAGVWLW